MHNNIDQHIVDIHEIILKEVEYICTYYILATAVYRL